MNCKLVLASTDADFMKLDAFDRSCGLITRSGDRSELIRVAHLLDDDRYEYIVTTLHRLKESGISYKGKVAEEKKSIFKKPEKKKVRYEMVFYPSNEEEE